MPSFEDLFRKSKGQPVTYNGRIIHMVDRIPIHDSQEVEVTFEGVNSDWRQGVCLTTDGSIVVNDQTIKKSVVLWRDTAPQKVALKIKTKKSELQIKNVWDSGDGVMQSWHNGGAMIIEKTLSGRRYLCNDGRPDANFSDLIFCIELVKQADETD